MEFKYTQKIKLNVKNKIFILLSFFVVFSFALIFFVILPEMKEIKKIKNNISESRLKIEEKYLAGINAKILSKQAPEVREKLEVIEGFLINPDEQLSFISSLEEVAEENNIIQTPRIEYDLAVKKKAYKEIPIKISTQGSFDNQIKYLEALLNLEKKISIESINIRVISKPRNYIDSPDEDVYVSFFITAKSFWIN